MIPRVVVKCQLHELIPGPEGNYNALITRLSDHPKLGGPTGGKTVTSLIKLISFEAGIFITMNTIYDFGPRP